MSYIQEYIIRKSRPRLLRVLGRRNHLGWKVNLYPCKVLAHIEILELGNPWYIPRWARPTLMGRQSLPYPTVVTTQGIWFHPPRERVKLRRVE